MYPIIDTHCHVYPDKIAQKAAAATGHFYGMPPMMDGTVETLQRISRQVGISHNVINSVATTYHQVESINNFIAECVKLYPDRLIGFGALHPDYEDIAGEAERIVSLGLKGIKLHPDFQQFQIDDEKVFPIYEAAVKHSFPVLFHAGDYRYDFSGPKRLRRAADMFPEMKIIGAHFAGWSQWDEAQELFTNGRIYVDLSSSLYDMTPERAAELIHSFGADKVMFGTDYPMWTAKEELQRFYKIPLTDEERELILYKNALALLGE